MYYPYFRGKQYELIVIRENAELLHQSQFVPIIEPVRPEPNSLQRAISEVEKAGGECVLIVNPKVGKLSKDSADLRLVLETGFRNSPALSVGILLTESTSVDDVTSLCARYRKHTATLVHCGFQDGRELAERITSCPNVTRHVFVEDCCGKLYRRHFQNSTRVLLRDGFQHRTNREHPPTEFFSDLHETFGDEGMAGFGDFLIVGDDYSESAGPAYAVAIHLTYIDDQKDGGMYIHHFLSDRKDTPADPAGKFAEALDKLAREVQRPDSPILRSRAVTEYLELHKERHFPGLGYVKKLSMQHHIETLANYFMRQPASE